MTYPPGYTIASKNKTGSSLSTNRMATQFERNTPTPEATETVLPEERGEPCPPPSVPDDHLSPRHSPTRPVPTTRSNQNEGAGPSRKRKEPCSGLYEDVLKMEKEKLDLELEMIAERKMFYEQGVVTMLQAQNTLFSINQYVQALLERHNSE